MRGGVLVGAADDRLAGHARQKTVPLAIATVARKASALNCASSRSVRRPRRVLITRGHGVNLGLNGPVRIGRIS
jgi:hypothetical protein